MKISEKAYAKINLNLFVLGKREDGFHELKSLVIPTSFYDELIFEISEKNEVNSNINIKDNLILKTIELFQKEFKIDYKVKVHLTKNIPIGSGLGGGSANAAATLRGLNRLFNLRLDFKDLKPLANELGSDVLFCLYNKPSIISGRGEFIEFVNYSSVKELAIIQLNLEVLTKDVFQNHKIIHHDFEKIELLEARHNDLLLTLLKINKEFSKIYYDLLKEFDNLFMTGSGPTLFLINPTNKDKAKLNKLQQRADYLEKIKIMYTN